ncbi:MAG: UDP-N-acetylmuramate--L-alanine ligase [Weeksellaceae bacterium]|nr:UDP-N-acetylmuramate--L-alanine ligase [Weeksellaceae bacterium]
MKVKDYTYYFFIGVGGIGMSALARYFLALGKEVHGYDKTKTSLTEQLQKEGVHIQFTDDVSSLSPNFNPDNCLVVYTPAVPKDLQILKHFYDQGFEVVKRSQLLGKLTHETKCMAIAGTHGKTTTSAILGHLLYEAGKPVTAFIGGILENYQSNVIIGGTDITVVEADEFDRSFLQLHPEYAVITSMDADHLDIYGNPLELENSFREFAGQVKKNVFVKAGIEIEGAISYGAEVQADYFADNIVISNAQFSFDITTPQGKIHDIQMSLPGRHNIENALAAVCIALQIGVSENEIKKGLESFKGVKRRFTRNTLPNGKVIIDDYAHHPTELNAIISATKNFYPQQKILGVFQPHLYSRTRDFIDDFAASLNKLEHLILLDIYPARELPIEGVTSQWLAQKMGRDVEVVSLANAIETIKQKDFDVLLLLGAGDIDTLYKPAQMIWHE